MKSDLAKITTMQKAEVYAKHNRARISPKKVRVVMDLVRGESVNSAKKILAFDTSKAAQMLLKVLKSAEANAASNNNLRSDDLYISELHVSGAEFLKRWRAGSKGRTDPYFRRNSNIVLGLSPIQKVEVSAPKKAEGKEEEKE